MLFLGWLSSRLDWRPETLVHHDGSLLGKAPARRQDVALELQRTTQSVPGLAGVTIETADGAALSLERGPGGLRALRRAPDGRERAWTILGASRGEGGILGEGIRQALLRDQTYRPALALARKLAA
jgi:D-serine deaminase-like pyridoxal phosphate-dependent protein